MESSLSTPAQVLQSLMEEVDAGLKDSMEDKSREVHSKSRAPKLHEQLGQE